MMFGLGGRTIAVMGGAGHLGSAICKTLSGLDATVMCLPQAGGWGIELTEEYLSEKLSGVSLDGMVYCAGRGPRSFDNAMSCDEFCDGLATSIGLMWSCNSAALKHMKHGSIVNVASMWGEVAPDPSIYPTPAIEPSPVTSAAAGGILALTRHMARQLAPDVRVNAVVPGWFPKKRGPDNPEYMAKIAARVPLGRIGQPSEIAGAVSFLLSNAASYITGQSLTVDGGYTIQ